ncbi:tyrosyl-tRNA synthetase [Ascosphaera pollenicola]|nr:tyrosyl-tRNA synthetase [Ascosphaera pollenicola]
MPFPSRFSGILHRYGAEKLTAFEFKTGNKPKPNTLIFIGGLTDGLGSVTLVDDIVKALEDTEWSIFTVLLSSSYKGFGTSSLDQDVKEIAQCVKYALQYKKETNGGKEGLVSIMGHSTGSQDVLHYIYTADSEAIPDRPQVHGAIMQSPVSDREAVLHLASQSDKSSSILQSKESSQQTVMRSSFPMTSWESKHMVALHEFAGVERDMEYVIREFKDSQISCIMSPKEDTAFASMSLGIRDWDIYTAHPVHTVGATKVAVLGLINKMTGAAALNKYEVKAASNDRVEVAAALKAFGVFGVFVSDLEGKTVAGNVMALLNGKAVPAELVSIDAEKKLLTIDVEKAWAELELNADKVEVTVLLK